MMKKVFLDTNVWVYALSGQDHVKRASAIALITQAFRDDTICVSSQVLREFANYAFKSRDARQSTRKT